MNTVYKLRIKKLTFLLLILGTSLSLNGCWYSFKGALPSYMQTIAIPAFSDRTGYSGLLQKVNEQVENAFLVDNTLKLVDISKADVVLEGTITNFNKKFAAVKAGETVSDYQITLFVKVVCQDIKKSKKMYEKVFRHSALMPSSGGQAEEDAAIDEALELIVDDILTTTLGGW